GAAVRLHHRCRRPLPRARAPRRGRARRARIRDMTTIAEQFRRLEGVDRPGLRFEDGEWTHAEVVAAAAARAAYLLEHRHEGPLPVGVLLENVPEYHLWLAAAALAGATVVGLNPTRRGPD